MCDSTGLVDFAIGLVIFVLNLPDGQVLFFGEIQITEVLIVIHSVLLPLLMINNGNSTDK